jgi:hypothetical protein
MDINTIVSNVESASSIFVTPADDRNLTTLGMTLDDAKNQMRLFAQFISGTKKIKDAGLGEDYLEFNLPKVDFENMKFDDSAIDLIERLLTSEIPKWRGRRPVFIDFDSQTVLVSTTVVYNVNWASIGVDDDSLLDKILEETDAYYD